MSRRHYFADLSTLKHRLEQHLHSSRRTMPWLLRQSLNRRLDQDGLRRDVVVLGACLTPLAVFVTVYVQVFSHTNLSGGFAQLATLAALVVLAWKCLSSAYHYIDSQAPASESKLLTLYSLVLADADAAEYVHALLDGNESPRNIDVAVAAALARQNGQTAPADFDGYVSIWTLWDWHYDIAYTNLANEHHRSRHEGEGRIW